MDNTLVQTEQSNGFLDIVHPDIDHFTAQELVDFFKVKQQGFENVPDFMIRDVYKSYFNTYEEMQYKCNDMMQWWHEMLQNTNNYLLKTVTQNKPGYSFIAMKHIINLLREEIEKNEDLKNHANSGGQGPDGQNDQSPGGGGGQPDFSQSNQNIQDKMEKAVKDASEEIEEKEQDAETVGDGNLAGKGVSDILLQEERIEMIKQVKVSKREIGKLINHSIKSFKKGFGSKTILSEESLFEADVVEDLIDEHYLFSELLADDVSVRDHRQLMTAFDLYIDVSGSMTEKMNVYGKQVQRLQMAIALACRMKGLGCLGEVYAFNDSIQKIGEEGIWHLRAHGGTSIEKCMQQIKKSGRPSVILTDGDDGFSTYTDMSFIMTISPSTGWSYWNQESVKKMIRNGKYIQYDGSSLIRPKLN